MFDRFAAAKLKIERANKHIADLEAIIQALPEAYECTIEPNEAGGETIRYNAPELPKISAQMALIIGDAVHNLRTAVEYSYLGVIEKYAPSALDRYTKFPTGKTREDVDSQLKGRKIDKLIPNLFDRILSDIKPYEVGGNCLAKFLHDLDVSDKHWLLIPLMRVSMLRDIVVEDENEGLVTGDSYPMHGEGTYFFDFRGKVKDKGQISVEVVFNDFDLLKGLPVLGDLKDLTKVANYIVDRLSTI